MSFDPTTLNADGWPCMLWEYQRGKLRKSKLLAALRDGKHTPTPDALTMIADVIEGKGPKLAQGRIGTPDNRKHAIADTIAMIESWIANPDALRQLLREEGEDDTLPIWIDQAHRRTTYKNRKSERETAHEQAKQLVAKGLRISTSTIEHARKRRKK